MLEFFKKPLVAHCRMLLRTGDYVPWGMKAFTGMKVDVTNARNFARRILEHLDLNISTCDDILYSGHHRDSGERVDLKGLWTDSDLTRKGIAAARKR